MSITPNSGFGVFFGQVWESVAQKGTCPVSYFNILVTETIPGINISLAGTDKNLLMMSVLMRYCIQVGVCSLLQLLVQAHDLEGSSSDLLVHDKHEGSRQHRL